MNGSEGVKPTLIFIAPCPTCPDDVVWHARPQQPAEPRCPRPTCNVQKLVEA